MALRSFPGGRTSEPAEFQCDVAPDFAGAGTGELVQRNDKAWSYSTTTVSPLVPGDGGSASCAARQQYSRHDGFARYAAEDRLLTEPIQPLRALQGRKISLNQSTPNAEVH